MMELHTPATESEKQKNMSLKIRIKLPRKKTPEKIASSSSSSSSSPSSSTWNRCSDCGASFSSTKALFGHLRIHRKKNRGSEKPSFSTFGQSKHADVIAANILMSMSRSKSEADINDAKFVQLKWICAKAERQRKMKMKETASRSEMASPSMLALRSEKSSSNEEVNAGAVVEMTAPTPLASVGPAEVEIHQCDKCEKAFNTGQALGGHKRAHYAGPPLCRPGSNGRSQAAVNAPPVTTQVAVHDFDLNEPAEDLFL